MMGVSTWPLNGQLGDHHEQIIWAAYTPNFQFRVQGQGGFGRFKGRQDLGRIESTVRIASQSDHRMETSVA